MESLCKQKKTVEMNRIGLVIKTFAVWFFLVLPLIIIGWLFIALILPFSLHRDTFPFMDSIYGNSIDSIHGDIMWRNEVGTGMWQTWLWSAWRNPVHNLLRMLGAEGKIDAISIKGKVTGGKAVIRAKIRGKNYTMYWRSGRFTGKYYQMMVGPKIWPMRIDEGRLRKTRAGDYVIAPLSVRILPWVSAKTAGVRE